MDGAWATLRSAADRGNHGQKIAGPELAAGVVVALREGCSGPPYVRLSRLTCEAEATHAFETSRGDVRFIGEGFEHSGLYPGCRCIETGATAGCLRVCRQEASCHLFILAYRVSYPELGALHCCISRIETGGAASADLWLDASSCSRRRSHAN